MAFSSSPTINHADLDLHAPSQRSLVQVYPVDLSRGPIELRRESLTLGRSRDCGVRIADHSVSRQHAEVRYGADGCEIIDLGSTNGLSVNGALVQRRTLQAGDQIQIGAHVFRYLASDDIEQQYHETVYSMMTRDGMTGVYNHRYLTETLEREVARCRRHCRPISTIMIDIDHLSAINCDHGHLVGDQVLREVAQRIQHVLRKDDVFARFGGNTFTALLVESDFEATVDVAMRCHDCVRLNPIDTSVGRIAVTISLGVAAPNTADLGTPQELLTEAEERLLEAKQGGRNRVVC